MVLPQNRLASLIGTAQVDDANQHKTGILAMNKTQPWLGARTAVGLLTACAAFGAHAQQVTIYTYQGQAFTTQNDGSNRFDDDGPPVGWEYTTDIDGPGIAFSFIVDGPIESGQTVSLRWFSGVMGQNGSFQSWNYENCDVGSCLVSRNSTDGVKDSLAWFQGHGVVEQFNLNAPGTWSNRVVTIGPKDGYLQHEYYSQRANAIAWVRPVPEADTSLMAVLGLAAVGALARRKARTA